jgi:tetratricopeptide (TPR) repeat protein
MQRRDVERASARPPVRRSADAQAETEAEAPTSRVLQLQSTVGNAAVASVLQRQPTERDVARARRIYTRAEGAYESGHYRRALRLWESLSTSPATTAEVMPDIVWNLAITHARLGDTDAAMTAAMTYGQYRPHEQEQLLDLIRRIQQEEARAEFNRAASAYEQGHYRRALRLYERLVQMPATTPEVLPDLIWNMALARARLGDMDGAMTDAMTYGQYRPDELAQLLALLEQIGRERATAGARRLYTEATEAYEGGRYRRALRLWEQLTVSPVTTPEIMPDLVWNIALAKARMGDIDGAMTAAMTYGQYRPDEQQQLIETIQGIRAGRVPAAR